MTRRLLALVSGLLWSTSTAAGQSLTTADSRVVLTVTKLERLAERRFYSGLGGHSPDEVQIERPPRGQEFVRLTLSVRWLPGQTPEPCSVDGPPPLLDMKQYMLVDGAGSGVRALETSFVGALQPCREYTVLFHPSRAGTVFATLHFNGGKASLGRVAGNSAADSPPR